MAARMERENRKPEICSCTTVQPSRKRRCVFGPSHWHRLRRIFGPADRNIVRHHQHGQQIQQEAEHAHRGGQRLTGEIGDPRRLHVLEYLHAEVLYLRHVERRVLLHRVHDLRVYRRKPLHHGDQLLHEHVAEQREQSHDDHGEADQAHRRREATLPAVSHHRDHQRLDRQRDEYRDDDIQHDGRYLAPRCPHENRGEHRDDRVQQRAPPPIRRSTRIPFGGEHRRQIQFLIIRFTHETLL